MSTSSREHAQPEAETELEILQPTVYRSPEWPDSGESDSGQEHTQEHQEGSERRRPSRPVYHTGPQARAILTAYYAGQNAGPRQTDSGRGTPSNFSRPLQHHLPQTGFALQLQLPDVPQPDPANVAEPSNNTASLAEDNDLRSAMFDNIDLHTPFADFSAVAPGANSLQASSEATAAAHRSADGSGQREEAVEPVQNPRREPIARPPAPGPKGRPETRSDERRHTWNGTSLDTRQEFDRMLQESQNRASRNRLNLPNSLVHPALRQASSQIPDQPQSQPQESGTEPTMDPTHGSGGDSHIDRHASASSHYPQQSESGLPMGEGRRRQAPGAPPTFGLQPGSSPQAAQSHSSSGAAHPSGIRTPGLEDVGGLTTNEAAGQSDENPEAGAPPVPPESSEARPPNQSGPRVT
ncbi:MAG: hypothetical protein M1822_007855 [Bathelium mastoideum]|nr:MAG: hypothetical protein M1822_007855 [Bathelium mastoideum]